MDPSANRYRGLESSLWCREPFRIFFPLGVVLGWVGISHWLLYAIGATQSYSCFFHGLVQLQAFMMAFAVGFLLTALPRRTQSRHASPVELLAIATALVTTAGAALAERWVLSELAYAALFVVLLRFAVVRLLGYGAGRRPPAAFALIPFGVLHGLGGAVLIIASTAPAAPGWTVGLGRLMVEQGVFLCFAVGVGGLVLPLVIGGTPPPDLDSSPGETWKALAFAGAGVAIFASCVLEQSGWVRGGPLLRALVMIAGLGSAGGAWRMPRKPGAHRWLVWLSVWLMPLGLVASALWPDYRVPALHIVFIGGFGLLAFGVATHVVLGHLNLEHLALGRPLPVVVLGACFLLAMLARLAADASNSYFDHLGWAAAMWLIGSAAWLAFVGPKLWRR